MDAAGDYMWQLALLAGAKKKKKPVAIVAVLM